MAWVYLVLAAFADTLWTSLLKAHGLIKSPLALVAFAVCLTVPFLVGAALKTVSLGNAYAVWMGLAILGAFFAGVVFFNEPVTFWRIFFIGLILAGILGLKYLDSTPPQV